MDLAFLIRQMSWLLQTILGVSRGVDVRSSC